MFHFPAFPPHALCVQAWVTAHDDCRVSPFGNPRITARLTTPRGLSWPPTSFIGSWCQGIHRAPLKTWPQMLASTMQFSNNDPSPAPTISRQLQPVWSPTRGNNSHSLRTQQRAQHNPRRTAFHSPKGCTNRRCETVLNSQRSTHEQPCETYAHSRLCAP
jgi:hypothetical protein